MPMEEIPMITSLLETRSISSPKIIGVLHFLSGCDDLSFVTSFTIDSEPNELLNIIHKKNWHKNFSKEHRAFDDCSCAASIGYYEQGFEIYILCFRPKTRMTLKKILWSLSQKHKCTNAIRDMLRPRLSPLPLCAKRYNAPDVKSQ